MFHNNNNNNNNNNINNNDNDNNNNIDNNRIYRAHILGSWRFTNLEKNMQTNKK